MQIQNPAKVRSSLPLRVFKQLLSSLVTVLHKKNNSHAAFQNNLYVKKSRATPQLARQRLIWTLASFIILNGSMIVWIYFQSQLRDPQFGDKLQRFQKRFLQEKPDHTIIMLGSSHTGMGLAAREMEDHLYQETAQSWLIYNFGIPSAGPIMELRHWHKIWLKMQQNQFHPDLVLLELHPALLSLTPAQPIEGRGLNLQQMESAELELLQRYGMINQANDITSWYLWNLMPFSSLRFELLGRVLPLWLPTGLRYDWGRKTDRCGWNASPWINPHPEQKNKAFAQAKMEYAVILENLRMEGQAAEAFQVLVQTIQNKNIPVVVVLTPEGEKFRQWYTPLSQHHLQNYLHELERKFHVPIINARDWNPENDFLDSHHLLQPGAKKFSLQLCKELIRRKIIPEAGR